MRQKELCIESWNQYYIWTHIMQPNKMGYFSHIQANVTAGKRDADQDVKEAKSLFQRRVQNYFIRRIPIFKHVLPKEAKEMSYICWSKGSSVGLFCQRTQSIPVWQITSLPLLVFIHTGDSDFHAYILVLWDADMIPRVGQGSSVTDTGQHVCYNGCMSSAAAVCHNPKRAPESNMLLSPFLDTKDTLHITS